MLIQISKRCLMVLLSLLCAATIYAQNATGSIHGTISDEHGAVVSNARVTVTSKATGNARTATTNSYGAYTFENLMPGEFDVKVEAQGFKSAIQNVTVKIGNTSSGDFAMKVGDTKEEVQVTGENAPIVNATDTVVGGVINRQMVNNLPLNGRSFLSIALLEPGVNVSYASTSGAGNPNNFFQVSVGGAPQQQTLISVDGARVNDRITGGTSQNFSSDTVQEYQISTLGFDLATGTVSAGAVNVVTRTGSNQFHGDGFFYFRDHNLAAFPGFKRPTDPSVVQNNSANPCFVPTSPICQSLQSPFFVRRQYGGSFGGPLKKDKIFLFFNYERDQQVGANSVTFTDPTLTGFNHVAQQPLRGNLINTRIDYTINNKNTAYLRNGFDINSGISGTGLESTWIASDNFAYQIQAGLTSVLSSAWVNDYRMSYSYFRNVLRPPTSAECNDVSGNSLFCTGLNGPRITFYGGLQVGTNINVTQDRHPHNYQYTDNVSWTKGDHRIRFGGNWEHTYGHGTWSQNATGSFSGTSPTTVNLLNPTLFNALPASLKPGGTGATFADLMQLPISGALAIGIGSALQPAPFNYDKLLRENALHFYVQDAWQYRKGLTINYGIGWSFDDLIFYHDLDLPQYLAPLLGANNLGKLPQHYKNFDPALGFAWAFGREQKSVIRASASLHHTSPNLNFFNLDQRILFGPSGNGLQSLSSASIANPKAGQAGQPANASYSGGANFTIADMLGFLPSAKSQLAGLVVGNGTDLSIRGINIFKTVAGSQLLDAVYDANSTRTPYSFQVDLGFQREIMRNLAVSVDFTMRRSVGFGAFELNFPDINRFFRVASYTIPASGTVTDANRVFNPVIPRCVAGQPATSPLSAANPLGQCSVGAIQYGSASILSRYSALQVKVDKRFSRGLQFTAAYAFAHYTTFGAVSSYDDPFDGTGVSTGNPRHRFTFSGIYELPKYKGDQKFIKGAVNGWQVSTIVQMSTATPISPVLGTNVSVLGAASGGFDVDGDGNYTFRLPGAPIGSFGNSLSDRDIRHLVDAYNAKFPAPKDTLVQNIGAANRDKAGTPYPFIVLPATFTNGDSFMTHDLRVSRMISVTEKVKFQIIAEGFNLFNIANYTGFSGTLDKYVRPILNANGTITPGRDPATFSFGQPTNKVNAVFGSGGARAYQFAFRLSF